MGSFTANGVPFGRPFANHDPIFFKVCGETVSLLPDLTETAISDPPATVRAGSRFHVTDTVRNDGPGTASISTTRFFLSVDTLKNRGDRHLRGRRIVPELPAGAESTGTTVVRVPLTTVPGTYFLLACADNKKSVAEVDDKNNCIASTTQVTVEP
jgi:subtilase family serine protease